MNKTANISFMEELTKLSELTGISKSNLLKFAWEEFKTSKKYAKIKLGID